MATLHPELSAVNSVDVGTNAPPRCPKIRQINGKAVGVTPDLFTTFGVWPEFRRGATVRVEIRLAHHFDDQGSTIDQLLAAGVSQSPAAANSTGDERDRQQRHQKKRSRLKRAAC